MSDHLHGGCSCGRNAYTITIPQNATEKPQVFFENSHGSRKSHATPLSAWLKVPLSWYQSTTQAFMTDESHAAIRRTYTSPSERDCQRHFCGFCGTPLSFWSESPPTEAPYISLTLGSLASGDLRDLEDLGLLPAEALEDTEVDQGKIEKAATLAGSSALSGQGNEGLPWFETMVKGSRLGNVQRIWGEKTAGNGRFKIEWEIVEWTAADEEGGDGSVPSAKRKIGQVVENDMMD
ncbi:hypothetical protein LZ554_004651 [Drepanopeziza brunnea f. sp. 'monogermtubi']|nr:hypothetical protein LZ554_004651 [Drepanopeziza brunnea f. sp. 'monogermtubi']